MKSVPTSDPQSERALLASILWKPTGVYEAMQIVSSSDMGISSNAVILETIFQMAELGLPVDVQTLGKQLEVRGELLAIGGYSYLTSLQRETPLYNVSSYASQVRASSERRQLSALCEAAKTLCDDPTESVEHCMDLIADGLQKVASTRNKTKAVLIGEYAIKAHDDLKRIAKRDGAVVGYTTGLLDLDEITTGIRPGELWIIGALAGRGKTALGAQMALANAMNGVETQMFSLEMSGEQITTRIFSPMTNIRALNLRNPKTLDEVQWSYLRESVERLAEMPLWVDASASLTIRELIARAKLAVRERKVKLIVVDYLRLVEAPGKELRERVAAVANGLRQLAKEENVAVVALSQLRRPSGINDRPTMLDLKESGDVEAHAHTVLLIYQPTESGIFTREDEIIIGKQRNGPLGVVPVMFYERTLTFQARDRS